MPGYTIGDIVPDTVTRSKDGHSKTSAGAPCPNNLARVVEEGALYFTPGGQTPVAIGGNVLLNAVNALVPGSSKREKFDAIPNVLNGLPPPNREVGTNSAASDSLYSLRSRAIKLDVHTTDLAVRRTAAEPRRKTPSNVPAKIKLFTHPEMKTCQSAFHATDSPANIVPRNRRVVMCDPCWNNYRFRRPGPGRRYYGVNNVRKSVRLWKHLQPLFEATPEAYCGYIAACAAQTDKFRASSSIPVGVLEEIGLAVALYMWAMPYADNSYAALRLLHTARPDRAAAIQARGKLRKPASEMVWWTRAEEHGVITRPLRPLRRSGWAAPVGAATEEHAVTWDRHHAFSVSALGVVAAVAGVHPRIKCTIHVRIGVSTAAPPARLPAIKMTRGGVASIKLPAAENVSWAYAWRCLTKAIDVADSLGFKGVVDVTLILEGNPLGEPAARSPHPAWDAILATSHAELLPRATGAFFRWALPQAVDRKALDTLAVAGMYPATAEQVGALQTGIARGFPPVEDLEMREAARIVFGAPDEATADAPLLGEDAL